MSGMHRTTGVEIDGEEDITQSVNDILSTPVGSLVGRRDYGSLVPDIIDKPMTGPNILRLFAASALAIARWEDRIRITRVGLVTGERPGSAALSIEAKRKGASTGNSLTRILLPLIA
jgi:phage baseplate assembly protein W